MLIKPMIDGWVKWVGKQTRVWRLVFKGNIKINTRKVALTSEITQYCHKLILLQDY